MESNTIYPFGPGGQTPTTIPIADDLVTNRADMALSAKQGVVLDGKVSQLGIESQSISDLDITDEAGNVLVRFSSGHVKTKYFDSGELSEDVLKKFEGKKIAIIGDSISTFKGWLPSNVAGYTGTTYAYYYPHGDVSNVAATWWYRVAMNLGIEPSNINNCAWSGSFVTTRGSVNSDSTTNAKPGCSTRRVTDLAVRGWNPDIIIIYISCNDWANDIAIGSWRITDGVPADGSILNLREAYSLMLHKIQVAYPEARVFCCTILDDLLRDHTQGFPSNNGNGVSTYEWNQNIKEIAEAFGCELIDLHACGVNYANIASYVVDEGLHPNAAGMQMMANKITNDLKTKY